MKRLFAFVVAAALTPAAFAMNDKEIGAFVTDMMKKNPQVSVKSVKVMGRDKIEGADGWESVRVLSDLSLDRGGQKQEFKTTEVFFVKGDLITPELMDGKRNKNFKQLVQPKIPTSFYDAEHFVGGNKNAKNKLVIFSDPLCPFCRDLVPDLINYAAKNPDKIALWHYAYPLTAIHPASAALVKAEIALKMRGAKDVLNKIYHTDVEPNSTDEEKILSTLSKELGLKITKADINSKIVLEKYDAELQDSYSMLIKGTPTLFVNGQLDVGRAKYNELAKELKK